MGKYKVVMTDRDRFPITPEERAVLEAAGGEYHAENPGFQVPAHLERLPDVPWPRPPDADKEFDRAGPRERGQRTKLIGGVREEWYIVTELHGTDTKGGSLLYDRIGR